MSEEARAAWIYSQAVMLQAKIAAMQAQNMQCQACGNSMTYGSDDFFAVIRDYESVLGSNEAWGFLTERTV